MEVAPWVVQKWDDIASQRDARPTVFLRRTEVDGFPDSAHYDGLEPVVEQTAARHSDISDQARGHGASSSGAAPEFPNLYEEMKKKYGQTKADLELAKRVQVEWRLDEERKLKKAEDENREKAKAFVEGPAAKRSSRRRNGRK